ncbi:DMT family transporter [Salipiger sp. PrR002]|uniref:DMT family transporter n=1 Tax=Salipiger sp. PrR002 TaxID=2706489 RepID=UPI0013B70686|nr:DMT family transporter [Salipiger sp. PrR002]NDW00028.1 EamA-like transporter family protein [Salipiger sp. PrR002]NDW56180.1 EamA-like transporter family protein [Salipiger sp. PrR004]
MIFLICLGVAAGMLVTLSRQLNGRLALTTSAMQSSFWNHLVGFVVLVPCALIAGSLWPETAASAPIFAWAGGAIGVIFVASGSWLIPRLGAALTGGLLVAGQMLSSVSLDLLRGEGGVLWMQIAGVALILLGVWLSRRR